MSWGIKNYKLHKKFRFVDFRTALEFVNKVGDIAEAQNHHPDICIYEYNKVEISIFTHSEGKITEKNYKLAEEIDKIT